MLRFRNLGSGSTGNATLVEASDGLTTTRLLIDCGFGIRQLESRLAMAGLATSDLNAVFITHEHSDHVGCARQLALRENIPLWTSHGTWRALGEPDMGALLHVMRDSVPVALGALQIIPFTVPHDAREPLQLTCSDGARRLGVLTDLGHATSHVLAQLAGCDALLLECNHDPALLQASVYPAFLKRRVAGDWGHLSNDSAAAIAGHLNHAGLRHVVAAHLSQQNNRPELAAAALAGALSCAANDVLIADALTGTGWLSA